MCARANNLRKFAEPRAGDISYSVWRTIGGYRGLRAKAMRRLAESELVPWSSAGELAEDIPVRRGRERALRAAQDWITDLEYQNLR
jgi:hypothetical protein